MEWHGARGGIVLRILDARWPLGCRKTDPEDVSVVLHKFQFVVLSTNDARELHNGVRGLTTHPLVACATLIIRGFFVKQTCDSVQACLCCCTWADSSQNSSRSCWERQPSADFVSPLNPAQVIPKTYLVPPQKLSHNSP